MKPSENEEEYFARLEMERRRETANLRQEQLAKEETERQRVLHHMRCPKCGSQLEEIPFGAIRVDKCFHCGGLWLDQGELETLQTKEPGYLHRLLHTLKS